MRSRADAATLSGYEGWEFIGAGGFGAVYRAHQVDLQRTVAIKLLSARTLDDKGRARFERERRALGRLSAHPNIVTVFESGFTDEGDAYLVMEFLAGGSLGAQLDRAQTIGWPQALALGVKLAGALENAHQAGVLHRDVKPENIMWSAYGEPVLGDFGIASVIGLDTVRTANVTASVAFAAPEVLAGGRPSAASDVYALAATLHALVRGHAPFVRDTDEGILPVITRTLTDPPPDLQSIGVPADIAVVLDRAMAKNPADRPVSALAFAHELQGLQAAHAQEVTRLVIEMRVVEGPQEPAPPSSQRTPQPVPPPSGGLLGLGIVLDEVVTGPVIEGGTGPVEVGAGSASDGGAGPVVDDRTGPIGRRSDPLLPSSTQSLTPRPPAPKVVLPPPAHGADSPVAASSAGASLVLHELPTEAHPSLEVPPTPLPLRPLTDTPPTRRWRALPAWVLPAALLTVVVVGGAVYALTRDDGHDDPPPPAVTTTTGSTVVVVETVAVPAVAGSAVADATIQLEALGLDVVVTEAADATVPAGAVISSDPAAAAELEAGATVTLMVSTGPAPVAVVEVAGQPADSASTQLTALGFVVQPTQEASATVPIGTVVRVDPVAGTPLPPGSPVTLVVSSGPAMVAVPDVAALEAAAARAALEGAGFVVVEATEEAGYAAPGYVLRTDPAAGSPVLPGTTVTIVVTVAPADTGTSNTGTPNTGTTGTTGGGGGTPPPPQLATVPSVTDSSYADAAAAVRAAGLNPARVLECQGEAGIVGSQSPVGGERVQPGSTVTLYVC